MSSVLETKRLILRQWQDSDYLPFAQLNADPYVMQYFPSPLSRDESGVMANKIRQLITKQGWGFWAIELKSSGAFIGFTGLNNPTADFSFKPCIEIGWRLARSFWKKGYATEAANAALEFGFKVLNLNEVVAFTALQNTPSRQLMERLQMSYQHDFQHPSLVTNHLLSRHCLYKITAQQFLASSLLSITPNFIPNS
jgi:RimJ/RimL family protein N-acetyltransferase